MLEPTTEIPSNTSLFPLLQPTRNTQEDVKFKCVLPYQALREIGSYQDMKKQNRSYFSKYVRNMHKYLVKMNTMFPSDLVQVGGTYANEANDIISSVCDTIFDRIESLRGKGTKPMKQRALVDFFKLLKKQGFSSMKWSVPNEVRDMNSILQLPTPNPSRLSQLHRKTLNDSEDYFRRNTIELSRLRSEITMIGSSYMSKREIELMTGYGDHGLLLLCQQRSIVSYVMAELCSISGLLNDFNTIHKKLPENQLSLSKMKRQVNDSYYTLLEILNQTHVAMKKIASFNHEQGETYRDLIGTFAGCLNLIEDVKPIDAAFVTEGQIVETIRLKEHLLTLQQNIEECNKLASNSSCLPTNYFQQCFLKGKECLERVEVFEAVVIGKKAMCDDRSKIARFDRLLSEIVESALLAAQNLQKGSPTEASLKGHIDEDRDAEGTKTIWENHYNILSEWDSVHLHKFSELLRELKQFLKENSDHIQKDEFHILSIHGSALVLKVMDICQYRLGANLKFLRSVAKFEYIKLRLFRVLVSKGFCADDVEEGGDGEGDASNMTFDDDVDGTGMGEGDGKNDVTDEIENEEQLLGLKGDEKEEKSNDQKELGEEEAEQGIEMENEFDGELFDVPENKEDENKEDEDDEEEELDREMGDGSDPNEQVVDEKMWDEEDDEEDGQQEEEKFEQDSKMTGESVQDGMRTKEEHEEDDNVKEGEENNMGDNGEDKKDETSPQDEHDDGKGEEDKINDDLEDNYEEQNVGVEVRNEEEDIDEPKEDDEEIMDFDDDMDLDGDDGDDGKQFSDNEDDQENQNEAGSVTEVDVEEDDNSDDESETGAEGIQNTHQSLAEDDQPNQEEDDDQNGNEEENEDENNVDSDMMNNANEQQYPEAQGVAASSGADKTKEVEENDEDGDEDDGAGDDNED